MSLSLFSSSNTMLLATDEALYIYMSSSKAVKLVEIVPWDAENFVNNVSDIIAKECGGKPVVIVNDMVEQHYRKEKVPRVNYFDKNNIAERKLNAAFPNYPIRAALSLKGKDTSAAKQKSDLYIFAAIPASQAFKSVIDATSRSLAAVKGVCLLPVESADMLQKLSKKLNVAPDQNGVSWSVFFGHHQSGGLRQIVIRNGELALTRMTPISEYDDPDSWAKEVAQEFKSTMSYLTRFGFQDTDTLNVIAVCDEAAALALNADMDIPGEFHTLTVQEAASYLSLSLGYGVQNEHYADPLHMAWIGRKRQLALPMRAQQIEDVSRPRSVASWLILGLIILGLFQFYRVATITPDVQSSRQEVAVLDQRKASLDQQFQKEVKRKKEQGVDILLIQNSIEVHEALEKRKIDIYQALNSVGIALGNNMRIDRFELKRGTVDVVSRFTRINTKTPLYVASMQMTFPSTTNAERGNEEVRKLQERIQRLLPDHNVKVSKFLEDYEYNEEIVVESGDVAKDNVDQDYVAEITIEGPLEQ